MLSSRLLDVVADVLVDLLPPRKKSRSSVTGTMAPFIGGGTLLLLLLLMLLLLLTDGLTGAGIEEDQLCHRAAPIEFCKKRKEKEN